jgi:hypothetical protein
MINGSGRGGGDGRDEDDDDEVGGPGLEARAAEALAESDDDSLLGLGAAVLAELKDRDLLRVMLRNRTDAATLFEVDEIRGGPGGLEVVAAGFHAETPDRYAGWVQEADALHARLSRPGLSEDEADAILGRASDEALLLELDRAQEEDEPRDEDDDEEEDEPKAAFALPGSDSAAREIGARVAIELLRRGVIESEDQA